jgi:S1-C subfamily serine protease
MRQLFQKLRVCFNLITERSKISTGVLSSTAGIRHNVATFQHSVPTNPGNSGGPLLNSKGHVVGVHFSGLRESQGIKFGVKMVVTRIFLDSFNVNYIRANDGPELRNEDIMDQAKRYTVQILCHR